MRRHGAQNIRRTDREADSRQFELAAQETRFPTRHTVHTWRQLRQRRRAG